MSRPCKISVVVPCFNHGQFLPEAIASVDSAGRDDLELIVIDDGSTDERTRVEMDKLAVTGGIKVIRQENKGLAAARNNAITASQGEYIFPLDADDRLHPGWIDNGIRILESNPQVGVVYGDAQRFGTETGRWIVGPFMGDLLLRTNYIHASALYRRSVWEQNRGYDGTMPVQGLEDWDFWLGALAHGWQFAYLPEVFFDYRQTPGSMVTHARLFVPQVEAFVGTKHGLLYAQAWRQLKLEHDQLKLEQRSIKGMCRNLSRLLALRLREKFVIVQKRTELKQQSSQAADLQAGKS
jgi:glycosyltransferase involved in cell wall biosynthesis